MLEKNICNKIETDENIGEYSGGSGHLSSKDYMLTEISEPVDDGKNIIVKYTYTISITTEFTIYPDNPPTEYTKEVTIAVDHSGNILNVISTDLLNSNFIM